MRRLPWLALAVGPLGCNAILGIQDHIEVLCEHGSECPSGFCSAELTCDDTQWVRRFGGSGDDEALDLLHFDPDREGPEPGVTIVVGSFEGEVDFGAGFELQSDGGRDAFVLALDDDGQTRWTRGFHGSGDEVAARVDVDSQGNLYVAGTLSGDANIGGIDVSISEGVSAGFIAKLSGEGNTDWVTSFGATEDLTVRDVGFVEAGVAAVGSYRGTFVNGPDVVAAERDSAYSLSLTPDGEYATAVGLPTTETSATCCVAMSDAYGIPVLAGVFAGTILNTVPAIVASAGVDGWFTRPVTGPDGAATFELGTSPSPITAMAPIGTRLVTAHRIEQAALVPVPQIAVVRFGYLDPSDGQLVRADDPSERATIVSLLTNDRDETYAFGQFTGELKFDEGPGFDVGHQSVFVAVMDSEFLLPTGRTRAFSGDGDVSAAGMAEDGEGLIRLAGSFERTLELGNDFGAPTAESAGGRDIYVASLQL